MSSGREARVCDACVQLGIEAVLDACVEDPPEDADEATRAAHLEARWERLVHADGAAELTVDEFLARYDAERVAWPHHPTEEGAATLYCTVCGRPQDGVARLVSGTRAVLCDGCLGEATRALASRGWRPT